MNTSIQLRVRNGQYICAEDGGGNVVVANRSIPLQWESFILINIQGTSLQDGSLVGIKCSNGQYVCAENGGGSDVVANRNRIGSWETFTIKKVGGTGAIQSGDRVAFLCGNGTNFLSADGGGGGKVSAGGKAIDIWETFVVTILPPRHVRIELAGVYCDDTEDVTGEDEFYITGSAVNRLDKKVTSILTTPIGINDGQDKEFPADQRIVFDGTVEATDTIIVTLRAFDEDAAKDWDKRGEQLTRMAKSISDGLQKIEIAGMKPAATAGIILELTVATFGFFVSLDQDDELGTFSAEIPVLSLAIPESSVDWQFSRHSDIKWSTWDYKVTLVTYVN